MHRYIALPVIAVVGLAACTGSAEQSDTTSTSESTPPTSAMTTADTTATDTTAPAATMAPSSSAPADSMSETTGAEWGSCEQVATADPSAQGIECATMQVPLDYSKPDGEMIDIAVVRSPSAGDPIGSLVFNPGGPGESGIEFLTGSLDGLPSELTDNFDLVSFDPRGVGASTPIDCPSLSEESEEESGSADDVNVEEMVAEREAEIAACPAEMFELAPHLGTVNVARDLDQIRELTGDAKLTYFGYSYGTLLGTVYAEMFPDNVRAMVLDGASRPSADTSDSMQEQRQGFEIAIKSFTDACDADPECTLSDHGPSLEVLNNLQAEIQAAGELPAGENNLSYDDFELAILSSLYSTSDWPTLAQGLELAQTSQDGSVLLELAESYSGAQEDGSYDNSSVAIWAINCADQAERPDLATLEQQASEQTETDGLFSALFSFDPGCYGLVESASPLQIGPGQGTPPILVIGTTGDPATPYKWAVELTDYLDSGVLFTVEGEGHTAFLTYECVNPVVFDYLINLTVPDPGEKCSDELDHFPAAEETGDEAQQVLDFLDCLRTEGLEVPDLTAEDLETTDIEAMFEEIFSSEDPTTADAIGACQELII